MAKSSNKTSLINDQISLVKINDRVTVDYSVGKNILGKVYIIGKTLSTLRIFLLHLPWNLTFFTFYRCEEKKSEQLQILKKVCFSFYKGVDQTRVERTRRHSKISPIVWLCAETFLCYKISDGEMIQKNLTPCPKKVWLCFFSKYTCLIHF